MGQKTGIRQWTEQRFISGCRVAFDPRTTAKAETTRDDKNYKAAEEWARKAVWQERQREDRREAAE